MCAVCSSIVACSIQSVPARRIQDAVYSERLSLATALLVPACRYASGVVSCSSHYLCYYSYYSLPHCKRAL